MNETENVIVKICILHKRFSKPKLVIVLFLLSFTRTVIVKTQFFYTHSTTIIMVNDDNNDDVGLYSSNSKRMQKEDDDGKNWIIPFIGLKLPRLCSQTSWPIYKLVVNFFSLALIIAYLLYILYHNAWFVDFFRSFFSFNSSVNSLFAISMVVCRKKEQTHIC